MQTLMKRLILTVIVFLSTFLIFHSKAQQSVENSCRYAKSLLRRVDSRNFNNFKKYYNQALKDIAEIELKSSTKKYGYDDIVDNAPGWIKLNLLLSDFKVSSISYSGESVVFKIVDYTPLLQEAKEKASKEHFDEALKVINASHIFENRLKVFSHLNKAKDISEEYTDKVRSYKAKVYYDEGLRLYDEEADFIMNQECISFFEKALNEVDSYKDTKELIAKIYSDQADNLSESNRLDDLRKAISLYDKAMYFVSNYNSAGSKVMVVKDKGASNLYQKAVKKEKEQSFSGQYQAANLFNEVNEWVNGYKDARERAHEARLHSYLNVVIQDESSKIILPNQSTDELLTTTKKYITIPKINHLNIDLSSTDNYKTVADELGAGFILIRLAENNTTYNYLGVDTQTNTHKIQKYYMNKRNIKTGKTIIKEISEEEYKTGIKQPRSAQSGSNYRTTYKTYYGTLSEITKTATVEASFTIEIWDVRDPLHPQKIKDIIKLENTADKKLKETYSGSIKVKPELKDEGEVKTKEELLTKAKNQKITVELIVKSKANEIAEVLNQIEYVHLK